MLVLQFFFSFSSLRKRFTHLYIKIEEVFGKTCLNGTVGNHKVLHGLFHYPSVEESEILLKLVWLVFHPNILTLILLSHLAP